MVNYDIEDIYIMMLKLGAFVLQSEDQLSFWYDDSGHYIRQRHYIVDGERGDIQHVAPEEIVFKWKK